jgi:hypothetical protein
MGYAMTPEEEIREMLSPWRLSTHRDDADTLRAYMDAVRDLAVKARAVTAWPGETPGEQETTPSAPLEARTRLA